MYKSQTLFSNLEKKKNGRCAAEPFSNWLLCTDSVYRPSVQTLCTDPVYGGMYNMTPHSSVQIWCTILCTPSTVQAGLYSSLYRGFCTGASVQAHCTTSSVQKVCTFFCTKPLYRGVCTTHNVQRGLYRGPVHKSVQRNCTRHLYRKLYRRFVRAFFQKFFIIL